MRRRLRNFLPIVLIALMVQIFAPIGACWAASIATSDPIGGSPICFSGSSGGQADQSGGHRAHDGCCSTCCAPQAAPFVDAPQAAVAEPYRLTTRVVWVEWASDLSVSRSGSNAQARAPPSLS